MKLPRAIALLCLAALLGLAGYSIRHSLWVAGSTPGDASFDSTLDEIERLGHAPGRDLIVISPFWMRGVWPRLEGKRHLFLSHFYDEPFHAWQRVWVVSGMGQFSPDEYRGRPFTLGAEWNDGRLWLHRLDFSDGRRALFDLREGLRRGAEVWLERSGAKRPCDRDGSDRHLCAPNEWHWVGPAVRHIEGNEWELIWAHPGPDPLVIRWPGVTIGNSIEMATCLTEFAAALPDGAPVTLELLIDGQPAGSMVQTNRRGLTRASFVTAAFSGQTLDLQVRISAPNPGRRHFLFAGQVVGSR